MGLFAKVSTRRRLAKKPGKGLWGLRQEIRRQNRENSLGVKVAKPVGWWFNFPDMPLSILLAEDNEDDAFFFKAAAKKLGWTHPIVVASNGREAIAELEKYAANPAAVERLSLVLLDLKMPFVGGLEVLEWAHARPEFRFLPRCVLSSSEQESDIETAYRLGAAAFLVKPTNPEGLHELLRTLEGFWLRHNRLPAARLDRASTQAQAASTS